MLHGDNVCAVKSYAIEEGLESVDDMPCIVTGPLVGLQVTEACDHVVRVRTLVVRRKSVIYPGCLDLNELMIAGRVLLYTKETGRKLYTASDRGKSACTATINLIRSHTPNHTCALYKACL